MAKKSYKIPAGMNATYADMEIAIMTKDGIGARPLPVKVILTYIGSFMLCFMTVNKTFISRGNFAQKAVFVVLWVLMTLLLATFDKTKRMQIQLLPTLADYVPKVNRHIRTRTSNTANAFYAISNGIEIDDNGLCTFADGTYGYWYRVVGSASILLFEEDKEAILNRVDAFYRKIGTDVECIFMTAKESQKVYRQIANLKRRYDVLTTDDSDLLELADTQYSVLKNYVGGTFKSIHQYLILKADNKEALTMNKNVLQSEVENSSLMIKQCTPIYRDDIHEVCRVIFRGKES